MRFHLRVRSFVLPIAAVGLTAALSSAPRSASAQTLSGGVVFATNATGASAGTDVWNTLGGDSIFNLWVSLAGSPINGTTDALAAINQSLATNGTYNFTIFGNPGLNAGNYGLNLFFNGNNNNPGISVYAPLATTAATPAFSVNSSASTLTVAANSVAAANTATFFGNGKQITLTNFRWESSTFQNQDVVGQFTRTPGNGVDNQGSFTLVVSSAAPEPSALALALVGGVPTLGIVLRRRKMLRANK